MALRWCRCSKCSGHLWCLWAQGLLVLHCSRICHCEPVCSPLGWFVVLVLLFPYPSSLSWVLVVHVVRGSSCWCGRLLWCVVRGLCGVMVCSCSRCVWGYTSSAYLGGGGCHKFPSPHSLLFHYCFSSIVESGLSAVVVNPQWLRALYKEIILAYTAVSRYQLLSFSSSQTFCIPFLGLEVFSSES